MIIVFPLSALDAVLLKYRPGGLVTLLNADEMIDTPAGLAADRHLRLSMNDISAPTEGLVAPRAKDAEALIDFIDRWDRQAPLAIHCWAGISRSTAAAFIAMCQLHPDASEHDLAARLRAASPSATPNRLIVAHADAAMGRRGRMVEAVEAIGRGADAWEGTVFELEMLDGAIAIDEARPANGRKAAGA